MHILLVVNDLAYFRAHRERLALDLLQMDYQVSIAAGGCDGVSMDGWDERLILHPIVLDKHRLRPMGDAKLAWHLAKIYRKIKPDIVHCITIKPILFGGIGLFLSRLGRRKTHMVWTFAGLGKIFESSYSPMKRLRRYMVQSVLVVLSKRYKVQATFENESDRHYLIEKAITTKTRGHALMGTGLDLQQFSPAPTPRNMDDNAPLIFFMATRLIKEKGVITYLEAARTVLDEGYNAIFKLAGLLDEENPDAVPLSILEEAEKQGTIEFLGALKQSEIPDALRNVDVSCAPTRLREGFPRALLEAAACGNAIIATNQSPMRVLVPATLEDKKTGWLIDPPDTENLTDAFRLALEDPQETRAMGTRSRQLVESIPVSAEAISKSFSRIYQLCKAG